MSEKKKGLFNRMFSTNGGSEAEPDEATVRNWLNEPDGPGGYRPRGYQGSGYQGSGLGGDRGQRQAFNELASGFGAGGGQPAPAWSPPSNDYADDDGGGVEIGNIGAGGPLAQAGLMEGDVIVAVDGSAVGTEEDLMAALNRLMPGRSAVLEVVRGSSTLTAVVVAPG